MYRNLNYHNPPLMQTYDIAFVGSGLSTSATLYHILSHLQKHKNPGQPKSIAVIEKSGEFWKGIAYGSRTSVHSLTINPIKDFFEEQEKPLFFDWLNNLKDHNWPGIGNVEKEILNNWIADNAGKLNDSAIEGLYIPRFLYGIYVAQKLEAIVAACKTGNLAHITLIAGEATDATKTDGLNQYTIAIQTDHGEVNLKTETLVLGTGSLDSTQITNGVQHQHLCIDDVYYPTLATNLKKIAEALAVLAPEQRNMMIVGSNASASEIVHLLCKDNKTQPDFFNKILILSGSGLPDRLHVNLDYAHLLLSLKELEDTGNYTADALMEAIEKDVKYAAGQQLSVGKIHYSLSDKVVKIQQKLDAEEALKFFNKHGWTFTRITRRTSENYYFTEQELTGVGKLHFVKGRFVKLCNEQNTADGLTFIYKESGDAIEKEFEKAFPIIINCAGAEHISNTTSKLIKNLLAKNLLKINDNNMGVAVDETFAANDNLYVIGPLMAGIYNSKFKFWHLENAKRLNGLGSILANTIAAKMLQTANH